MTVDEHSYTVQGMTCGHCEASVQEAVRGVAGARAADADRTTGRLTVTGAVDGDAVREAVRAAGYEVVA